MITNTDSLRSVIKAAMEKQGKNSYLVAKGAKISRPAFGRFLSGGKKGLNMETMFKVLNELGIKGLEAIDA